MAKSQGSELVPVDEDKNIIEYQEPIELHNVLQQMGLGGEHILAKDLVDQKFDICRVKPFDSAYAGREIVYYVVCRRIDTREFFTTTFGGAAVCDILDQYFEVRNRPPLRVTLRWKEGGKYNGYYALE